MDFELCTLYVSKTFLIKTSLPKCECLRGMKGKGEAVALKGKVSSKAHSIGFPKVKGKVSSKAQSVGFPKVKAERQLVKGHRKLRSCPQYLSWAHTQVKVAG